MVCCDRCGIAPSFDQNNDAVRLAEMQPAFGVTALLCLECRKMWYKTIHMHDVFKKYQASAFELEYWRTEHRKRGTGTLAAGKVLLEQLNHLEEQGCMVLQHLIDDGLTRAEKIARRDKERDRDDLIPSDDDD